MAKPGVNKGNKQSKHGPVYKVYIAIVVIALAMMTLRNYLDGGVFLEKPSKLTGKVAIVTGGTDGIGVETVRTLFQLGAHVVLPARNLAKAEAVVAELLQDQAFNSEGKPLGNLTIIECDLSSLASVQKFVDAFSDQFFDLHYLINNAGSQTTTQRETVDAMEEMLQVNHMSHFLMTNLLLPKLKASGSLADPARVVSVSSALHYKGTLHWDQLSAGRLSSAADFGMMSSYSHSKLLNVVFANELQRRIDTQPLLAGTITSSSLHPGVIATGLGREMNIVVRYLAKLVLGFFGKSVKQGAQTTLYAALSSEVKGKGALYFSDCETVTPHADAVYVKGQPFPAGEKLWTVSQTLLNHRGIAVGVRPRPKDTGVGRLGKTQKADDAVALVYAVVRSAVEEQANVSGEYELLSYATQAEKGTNFFIKVAYGEAVLHVKVFRAAGEDEQPTLMSFQSDKKVKDNLELF